MYNPYDRLRTQQKLLEGSNESFQKHMDEHWKEKMKKENRKFRLTIIIATIGLIIAFIALFTTHKETKSPQIHKPDTTHQQAK